jgi:hypothetical protein
MSSISVRGRDLSLRRYIETGSGPHLVSDAMGTSGSFPGCKKDESVKPVNDWLQSGAEVKNVWNYTAIPPTRIKRRENHQIFLVKISVHY